MYVAPVDIKIVNTAEVRKMLEEYKKNLANRSFRSIMVISTGRAISVPDRFIKKRWKRRCWTTSPTTLCPTGMMILTIKKQSRLALLFCALT